MSGSQSDIPATAAAAAPRTTPLHRVDLSQHDAAGIVALHLDVDLDNAAARRFYEDQGLQTRERFNLMSVRLT